DRITTAGGVTSFTGDRILQPRYITRGPDGAMWFTDEASNVVGRITTNVTPAITNFTPRSATVGTKITIEGTSLGSATDVAFNGVSAAILSNSTTKIVVKVPTGATRGRITVTTAIGTATSKANFA